MSDRTDIEIPNTGLLPETPADAPAAREPTARELMMEKIVANRERAIAAEVGAAETFGQQTDPADSREHHSATRPANPALGEVEDDRDYHDPYAVEDAAPGRAPERVEAAPVAPPPAPAPSAPQTFAVEVDGQQLHVTQDQLVHLARMGVVANQALHQYQTQQYQQPQPQPVQRAAPPPPVVDEERVKHTVKAIQYGDEASAAQALTDLVQHVVSRQPQAPQVDAVAIGNYAAQKARAEAKLEHETQIIRQEYADVMNNRYLANMAATRVAEIRQHNASLGRAQSDLEVYREAGNFVLETIGKPRPGHQVDHQSGETGITAPQAPNVVVRRSSGEIDARKRAAPRAMSQVIDRRSAAPQAPRPPSGADIVEQMRKQRFQTSMR